VINSILDEAIEKVAGSKKETIVDPLNVNSSTF
jgi:hypothetical protein